MSEPDAVPLPREGEVFFDVRGEARSMRLSWYADSRVAVFSIWQANRCTGTFRLPFADLAKMVQTLHSGPRPYQAPRAVPDYGGEQGFGPEPAAWHGTGAPATQAYAASPVYPQDAGHPQEPGHAPGPGYAEEPGYGRGPGYEPGREGQFRGNQDYALADYDPPDYQDGPRDGDAYLSSASAAGGGYWPNGNGHAGHDGAGYQRPGDRTGYERTGEYRVPEDHAEHGRDWPSAATATRPGPRISEHDLPSFPSVPARTGQSSADWSSTEWGAATAAYPGS